MRLAIRPWCARVKYPGQDEFTAGTITLPAEAQTHEILAALEAHFATFLPPGYDIVRPLCGSLFFSRYEEVEEVKA